VPGHTSKASRALPLRLLDVVSVVVFSLLWLVLAVRLVGAATLSSISTPSTPWQLIASLAVALPTGYLAADLVSGVIHWVADSFFDETTPLIGSLLIQPFREHHRDPEGITRHGFFEAAGNSCLVTLPPLAALWLWGATGGPAGIVAIFGLAVALCAALGVFATNLIHRSAHVPEANQRASIAALQRCGLILSAGHHAQHHQGANDCAYCVTCGWLNPLLDRFDVFGRLAAWIHQRSRRPGAHA